MAAPISDDEKNLKTEARTLEIVSEFLPDTDPDTLLAAAGELMDAANAARNLGELGVVKTFGIDMVMGNGTPLRLEVDLE